MPKISIIIASNDILSNGDIKSDCICASTFPMEFLEIIIVGHTNEHIILKEFTHASNFYNIQINPSQTLHEGINKGIIKAKGDYIFFYDNESDFLPDFLESLYKHAQIIKSDVTRPLVKFIDVNNNELSDLSIPKEVLRSPHPQSIPKAMLDQTVGFSYIALYRRRFLIDNNISFSELGYEDIFFSYKCAVFSANYAQCSQAIYRQIEENSAKEVISTSYIRGWSNAVEKTLTLASDYNIWTTARSNMLGFFAIKSLLSKSSIHNSTLTETCTYIYKSFRTLIIPTKHNPINRFHDNYMRYDWNNISHEQCVSLLSLINNNKNVIVTPHLTRPSLDLSGYIIFICEVDYHVENAVSITAEMNCENIIIIDLSYKLYKTKKRKISIDRYKEILKHSPKVVIFDETLFEELFNQQNLAAVVVFNDFGIARKLIKQLKIFSTPSIGIVEGMQDFYRLNTASQMGFYPYRLVDKVLLSGEGDKPYFKEKNYAVTGIPKIKSLLQKTIPKKTNDVAINVNFSYGILQSIRQKFTIQVTDACNNLGLSYEITQHPSDEGMLDDFNVTSLPQNELILSSRVFISRYATGIVESLALGTPVVYYKLDAEKIDKFDNPMGAYTIARSPRELEHAIQFEIDQLSKGIDIKIRAEKFLNFHTNCFSKQSAALLIAQEIIKTTPAPLQNISITPRFDCDSQSDILVSPHNPMILSLKTSNKKFPAMSYVKTTALALAQKLKP